MIVEVCVGSSCYLRGAAEIIAALQRLIDEHAPGRVELKGTFCLESCTKGVTVRVGGRIFAGLKPGEDVERFFWQEVMPFLG